MAKTQNPPTTSEILSSLEETLMDLTVDKESAEAILSLESLVKSLAAEWTPKPEVQQGKVISRWFKATFDLAIPAQRDKWFETLEGAPTFVASREEKLFVGRLVADGETIAEIKSSDLGQATFFRNVVEAYPVWLKKNGRVKEVGTSSSGRVNEQKVKDLHLFGFSAAEIAADLGRDESLIQEVMTRLKLVQA